MLKNVKPSLLEAVQPLHQAKIDLKERPARLPVLPPKHGV
jgi:hypothetical protein